MTKMTNMPDAVSPMDMIVLLAVLFTVAFFVAWVCSRNLRTWMERPKYRFLANVEDYDRGAEAKAFRD